jgi:hypothetical protein
METKTDWRHQKSTHLASAVRSLRNARQGTNLTIKDVKYQQKV